MGVGRAQIARRGIAEALLWVKCDADHLARGLLDKLWGKDFLSQAAAHAQEDRNHSVKVCALRKFDEMQRLQMGVAWLHMLETIHCLEIVDELSCGGHCWLLLLLLLAPEVRESLMGVAECPWPTAEARRPENV